MAVLKKRKVVKQINRKTILAILRNSGEISVAELSKKVDLSKTTLMDIMNYYIGKELVVVTGKGESTEEGGKKPNIFKFNADGGYAVGIVIFANKLLSVITNLRGEILDKISVELQTNEKFNIVLKKLVNSYGQLINDAGIDRKKIIGLAVGTYGVTNFDKGVVIFSPHFPSWGENIELKKNISEQISDKIPIYVDNGNRFQAFAEKTSGIARNKKNIVTLIAGKGLGSGVIMDNEIKRGEHFLVGEVGHMIINPVRGEICACGGRGCFEAMVSTGRIIQMAKEKYDRYPDSLVFNGGNPDEIDIYSVFNASAKYDELALELIDDVINWFAIGISNIILLYDPQMIVIQGIFVKAGEYFIENLRKKVNEISLPKIKKETKIEYSKLGDKVGVLGAASYVISKYFE
mgnify:CR=1 FL=1